jgi:hypothetical protein
METWPVFAQKGKKNVAMVLTCAQYGARPIKLAMAAGIRATLCRRIKTQKSEKDGSEGDADGKNEP